MDYIMLQRSLLAYPEPAFLIQLSSSNTTGNFSLKKKTSLRQPKKEVRQHKPRLILDFYKKLFSPVIKLKTKEVRV